MVNSLNEFWIREDYLWKDLTFFFFFKHHSTPCISTVQLRLCQIGLGSFSIQLCTIVMNTDVKVEKV